MSALVDARDAFHPSRARPDKRLRQAARRFAHLVALAGAGEAFLAAEFARRRIIAALAALARPTPATFAADAARLSAQALLRTYAPDAPEGLPRALGALTEEAFRPETLFLVLDLLRQGGDGAKTLRHAPAIDRVLLLKLARLPAAFRRGAIVGRLTLAECRDLGVAVQERVGLYPDPQRLRALAERWTRLPDAVAMWGALEEFAPKHNAPIRPRPWMRRVLAASALEALAARFRNCLRDHTDTLRSGCHAYYEVLEPEPAVFELSYETRFGGWLLIEVSGMGNAPIGRDLWALLQVAFAEDGVLIDEDYPRWRVEG